MAFADPQLKVDDPPELTVPGFAVNHTVGGLLPPTGGGVAPGIKPPQHLPVLQAAPPSHLPILAQLAVE